VVADPTTPKGSLTMLSRAAQSGDSSGVRDLFYSTTPDQKKIADTLLDRTEVYAKFRMAIVKAFDEKAAEQLTGIREGDDAAAEQRIAQADVKTDSDKATVTMKPEGPGAPEEPPIQMVRVDGKWKLPMAAMTEGMAAGDVDERISQIKLLSVVVTQLTGEVSQNKYKTVDEVADALRGKLASAMLSAAGATTKPATAP
jgi:hypothetical protein